MKNNDHFDFRPEDDEQSSNIGVVCPHCGHMNRDDLHSVEEGEQGFTCDDCSKDFSAWLDVSVTYYSKKDEEE